MLFRSQQISEQLEIEPVKFGYMPNGIKFVGVEIDDALKEACIL